MNESLINSNKIAQLFGSVSIRPATVGRRRTNSCACTTFYATHNRFLPVAFCTNRNKINRPSNPAKSVIFREICEEHTYRLPVFPAPTGWLF